LFAIHSCAEGSIEVDVGRTDQKRAMGHEMCVVLSSSDRFVQTPAV
jgi:hypothetical protein